LFLYKSQSNQLKYPQLMKLLPMIINGFIYIGIELTY
jgi:hypothetical protein